tara:strand:- start:280 stop:504 length:225 start_codon:yes stop_codon:yes gene_type:complete
VSKLVGVRFLRIDRIHYFDPGDLDLSLLETVVVETESGPETALVVIEPSQVMYSEALGPFKSVLRRATLDDLKQ